ncbi:hypothetical protein [Actinomadura gamaensis]|uniref:Heavy metal-binding domain-containing protein n=1 Tax=Actinomadura gamaensis TaxID=1763541 RepID=A0ABV9U161_9ACTN
MIPIYTTDTIPIAASAGTVLQAWPAWVNEVDDIGRGLDQLAQDAAGRGAHAIVGLRISSFWSESRVRVKHSLVGTAVVLSTVTST